MDIVLECMFAMCRVRIQKMIQVEIRSIDDTSKRHFIVLLTKSSRTSSKPNGLIALKLIFLAIYTTTTKLVTYKLEK